MRERRSMINPSDYIPKRPRGRPSSPSRTDVHREDMLHHVIASVHPRPGARLKPLAKLVIDNNGGPQDVREVRRIRDRYWNHFERPQQYDRIRLWHAERGSRARIRADSPDLSEAVWNGWFPVKAINGELIIQRHVSR